MAYLILAAIAVAAGALVAGCAPVRPAVPTPPPLTRVPVVYQQFSQSLDVLAILSVLIIGGAIALFLLVPAQHRLSLILAGGAGGVLAVALVVKLTLWIIPWIAGGMLLLAAIAFAYELYYKKKHGVFDKIGDGKGNL